MSESDLRRLDWILGLACAGLVGWLLWRDAGVRWASEREQVNIELGLWATRFLIAALAVSPVAEALRQPLLKRLRRPLGLGAAALAVVHTGQFLVYTSAWPDRLDVVFIRPYLTMGLVAVALMVPLAATSFNAAIRRLGPLRWRRLHWLVYPAAALTAGHEFLCRADLMSEVGVQIVLLAALLAWRLRGLRSRRRSLRGAGRPRPAPRP